VRTRAAGTWRAWKISGGRGAGAAVYMPNFLDGFDRLVAFDAETTGKRTPDAEYIRKQPFAWKAPGIIIEVGFVELLREDEGWRKGEAWSSKVNPDGPIDPEAIKIHRIRPADLKNAPRFPMILPKVKDFVRDSPIVAHAYKNERDFRSNDAGQCANDDKAMWLVVTRGPVGIFGVSSVDLP
jgi:DNA polymerase III epsilon subunit-like protein